MTNFTVTGSWTSQGTVNGTVSFTPLPSTAGTPTSATISASTLSTTLTVIAGSYLVSFQGMTLNGVSGVIESFVFASPQSATTVNLNTIAFPVPNVVTATTPPASAPGPLSYAAAANPGTITVANSTLATTVASLTLSANQLAIGSTFRTTIRGTVQVAATSGTLTFSPFVGPNVSSETFQLASVTTGTGPGAFFLQHDTTVQQVGASGVYICHGYGRIELAAPGPYVLSTIAATTAIVDTTQLSVQLQTQAQWATASASNILTVTTSTIERVV